MLTPPPPPTNGRTENACNAHLDKGLMKTQVDYDAAKTGTTTTRATGKLFFWYKIETSECKGF